MTDQMTAYVATNAKSQLQLTRIPIPTPRPEQVLIRVHAASINPVDTNYQMMHQLFAVPVHYPMTLGNDFSGTIEALGSAVTGLKVGEQVYGRTPHAETGTFAEYLTIDAVAVARVPANISLTAAAGIPLVGLTAYQALHDRLQITAGQRVFINAGSGGVGSLAIQMAKARGAYVVTTASPRNQALLKTLGADLVLDYHQTDFATVLHDFDAAFDTHGKGEAARMLKILRPGGKLVTIADIPPLSFSRERHLDPLRRSLLAAAYLPLGPKVRAAKVDYQFLLMHSSGQQLARLTQLIEAGQLQPLVDQTTRFQAIEQAIAYAGQGHATGKVIVTM